MKNQTNKQPDSVDDLFSFTADETGVSRETVRFVIKNFEKTLAYYLRNPMEAGSKIIIHGFVKIFFKIDDALARLDTLERYMPRSKDIPYYKQYFKSIIEYGQEEEQENSSNDQA